MADRDYKAEGIKSGADKAQKTQDFAAWLQGHGIGDGSPASVTQWILKGGKLSEVDDRARRFGDLMTEFSTSYEPNNPVPDASESAPQVSYNFEGDLSGPGLMEQYAQQVFDRGQQPSALGDYWSKNADTFGKPGQGDQYWEGLQGGFQAAKNLPNNAQGAYDSFAKSAPADTSPYFDYATQRATKELNSAAAARGMLNSSGSLQQIADMQANLRGQQARENAGYGLQRAGLGGQLASSADNSGRSNLNSQLGWLQGAQGMELNRTMAGAQVAGQVDQNNLTGVLGYGQVFGQGQNALRNRANDYFGNQMGMGAAMGGAYQNIYGGAMAADQNAWENAQQGNVAAAKENATASNNRAAQNNQNFGTFATVTSNPNMPWNKPAGAPSQNQNWTTPQPKAPGTGVAGSGVKPKF